MFMLLSILLLDKKNERKRKKKKPKNLNLICNEDIQDLETKLSMASNPLNQSIQESDAVNVKAVKHSNFQRMIPTLKYKFLPLTTGNKFFWSYHTMQSTLEQT